MCDARLFRGRRLKVEAVGCSGAISDINAYAVSVPPLKNEHFGPLRDEFPALPRERPGAGMTSVSCEAGLVHCAAGPENHRPFKQLKRVSP